MIHQVIKKDPRVSIAKTDLGIKEALRRALNGIGGLSEFIRRGETVLVKPNLTGERGPFTGAVTNPEVVQALIELIYELKPREIYLGDSPSWGFNPEKIYDITGMRRVAAETGCTLINLDEDERVERSIPEGWKLKKIPIARSVLACDKLINVPVMKTHMQCVVSLGIKNMKGVLPGKSKTLLHDLDSQNGYSGLDVGVADLHRLIQPDLTILDGTIAMEGRGPLDGDPVNLGLILAGTNPVWVDAAGAALMGFDPAEIPTLKLCAEVDSLGLSDYEIVGPSIDSVMRKFKPCPTEVYAGENIQVFTGVVCSGCLATFNTAIHRLTQSRDLEKVKPMVLGLGKNPPISLPSERRMYVGNCAAKGFHKREGIFLVDGCPPTGWRIVQAIKDTGTSS